MIERRMLKLRIGAFKLIETGSEIHESFEKLNKLDGNLRIWEYWKRVCFQHRHRKDI